MPPLKSSQILITKHLMLDTTSKLIGTFSTINYSKMSNVQIIAIYFEETIKTVGTSK